MPTPEIPPQEPFKFNDYGIVLIHFLALVLFAVLIPLTTQFVQMVVLIAFALLLVKSVKEVSDRF